MSHKDPKNQQNEENPVTEVEKTEVNGEDTPETNDSESLSRSEKKRLESELADKAKALSALETELTDTKEKYLRMMAEYENFRRRSTKEREGLYTEAIFDVLAGILPVVDNLERATAICGENEQVSKGLQMIMHSVEELLNKYGVEAYGQAGDIFDPNLHNAVMHDEDPEKPEGYVSDVFMKGYKKGERILRFAMVKALN